MRNAAGLVILAAVLSVLGGCASGQGYTSANYRSLGIQRVAIVSVAGDVPGTAAANQIAGFFGNELRSKGYAVTDFQQATAAVGNAGLTGTQMNTPADAKKVGEAVGADGLMFIDVQEFGQNMTFNARIVDANTGETAWSATGHGSTERTWITIGSAAAGAITGAAVGGSGSGRVVGGVIGAGAGGAGGYFLSPKQESVAKKVAGKMGESLPMR